MPRIQRVSHAYHLGTDRTCVWATGSGSRDDDYCLPINWASVQRESLLLRDCLCMSLL